MTDNATNLNIVKKILHPGTKQASFKDGTKVFFHFQTRLCNEERTLIDDSKTMGAGKPLELILGKKFKLEVWEAIVQMMAVNEVAQFTVNQKLVVQYPFLSKTLRDANNPTKQKSHCCAQTLQQQGIGYDDLDNLMKTPYDLEFTIDLLKVEQVDEYEKESWQMTENEQLQHVQELKLKGNEMFKREDCKSASDVYAKAIGILERLILKEKPKSEEWQKLYALKLPLLLNFSQCKLMEGEFYEVIEHCTTVLGVDQDNVKALYKRAKAHVGAWNPTEARKDFEKVAELDGSLKGSVKKELDELDKLIRTKDNVDKGMLNGMFVK